MLVTFLSPIPALIGAAVALPALVLLYFLKLRRREVRVSTTMLWLQSVEDLEANAPFQRLKPSLLFWLQVLVVAAVLLALARPTREIEGSGADSEHVILMIDVSASMQALLDPDGQTTRFDDARRRARELLDRLIRRSTRPQVMLMSVGHRPTTVVPWTGDLPVIRAALDDLQVRDEPARFGPAMQLADVLAMSSGAPQGGNGTASQSPVLAILYSDGRFADQEPASTGSSALVLDYVCIGQQGSEGSGEQADRIPVSNVGIITCAAAAVEGHRDLADVLVVIGNAGSEPVRVPLTLTVSGRPQSARIVEVPPAETDGRGGLGRAAAEFRIPLDDAALVRAKLSRSDQLAVDNSAALVLQSGMPVSILTVSPSGRPMRLLRDLLELLDADAVEDVTSAVYEERVSSGALGRSTVVVFDRYAPQSTPPLPSLSFGACPPLPVWQRTLADAPSGNGQPADMTSIMSWERMHPLLVSVGLDGLVVTDRQRLTVQSPAEQEAARAVAGSAPWSVTPLVLAPDGALIALAQRGMQRHVAVAFDLLDSNWPIDPGFAVFVLNVIEYLTEAQRGSSVGVSHRTTESINLPVGRGWPGGAVHLEGPNDWSLDVEDLTDGVATLPALPAVGLYRATAGARREDGAAEGRDIAVNLLSEVETDIRPVPRLEVQGREIEVGQAAQAARQELWPWFVGFAVLGLFVEWWVYTRRASL